MHNNFITCLQLFVIGIGFSFFGPCILTCIPVILAYTQGSGKDFRKSIGDIVIFLFARLVAYVLLGFFAGISGLMLNEFFAARAAHYFRLIAGLISILLAIVVFTGSVKREPFCSIGKNKALNFGNLFGFGFVVGISPCFPLVLLLSEVMLISKTPFQGALYTFSFGLGTFISSFVILAAISGSIGALAKRVFVSDFARAILKTSCSLALLAIGVYLIYAG